MLGVFTLGMIFPQANNTVRIYFNSLWNIRWAYVRSVYSLYDISTGKQ